MVTLSHDMAMKPTFSALWNAYSTSVHTCSLNMTNQCAIRVSRAMIKAGFPKSTFRGPSYQGKLCPHGFARGAQDLGAMLQKVWGNRNAGWAAPGSKPRAASGLRGVICFMNIPSYGGQGHIDLWDGSTTKTGEYWDSQTIWLWSLA